MADGAVWKLEKYRPFILLLARGLLRDWPQLRAKINPSDLTQEVLLKAFQGLTQFRGTTEAELLSWMRVILAREFQNVCRRLVLNQGRSPTLERSLEDSLTRSSVRLGAFLEASQPPPGETAQTREALLDLAAALETLPPDEYEMLVAHEIEGESYRRIAERLGVAPATVLNHVTEALKKMRVRLAGHDSEAKHEQ
ncbi:MAG TPA: sigma-70 family RNA polymerase sigma factor [Gemmataceae bacterium]